MTRKSPSQPNSTYGRSPALDPDVNTVAIPRMGDEFTGNRVQAWLKEADKRRPKT